ncbi:MAG: flavin reductase family protein, partial [Spirochaetes bacterium]|nr:flavin reductase family protein [Spirochaetota bacterium]
CKVVKYFDTGTYVVYIGEVIDAQILKKGEPLTYSYYYNAKNGLTPKSAPTYINKEENVN